MSRMFKDGDKIIEIFRNPAGKATVLEFIPNYSGSGIVNAADVYKIKYDDRSRVYTFSKEFVEREFILYISHQLSQSIVPPTSFSNVKFFAKRAVVGGMVFEATDKDCSHEFVDYVGFSESYKYCKKCDHKP